MSVSEELTNIDRHSYNLFISVKRMGELDYSPEPYCVSFVGKDWEESKQ